jgi:hypothetical protein
VIYTVKTTLRSRHDSPIFALVRQYRVMEDQAARWLAWILLLVMGFILE